MKKQNFSLIEILVVIGLIGILAGLAFPAYNSVQRKARENAAVAGCNSLAMAIKQFETTYSKYPTNVTIADPIGGKVRSSDPDAYENLLEALTGTTAGTTTTSWVGGNSRKIRFLDPGPDYVKAYDANNPRHGSFTNPWGQRYWVYWNTTGDNKIEFKRAKNGVLSNATGDKVTLLTDVAVFCELDPVGPYYKKGTRLATSWGGMKDFE